MDAMATAATTHRVPIRFVGSGSEYFRIWITNLLLTLVTFGLYYPFAKVRRLRYFHGCTEAGGHAFAFHGDPWRMFRGFLLVAVLFGAYGVAQRVSPMAGVVAFAVLAAVWPALWHASLRFRLANTGWRGLRFAFTGSRRGAYAALLPAYVAVLALVAAGALVGTFGERPPLWAAMLPLAATLVLAALWPWLTWRMKRYQHSNYRLGDEDSRMPLGLRDVYAMFVRAFIVFVLVFVVFIGLMLVAAFVLRPASGGSGATPAAIWWSLAPVLVFLGALQIVLRPYVTARLQNLIWNATRSAHVQFESRLRFRDLAAVTLRNWALMIVTLGLYYPFALVATARVRLHAVDVVSSVDLAALVGGRVPDATATGDAAVDAIGFDIGL